MRAIKRNSSQCFAITHWVSSDAMEAVQGAAQVSGLALQASCNNNNNSV